MAADAAEALPQAHSEAERLLGSAWYTRVRPWRSQNTTFPCAASLDSGHAGPSRQTWTASDSPAVSGRARSSRRAVQPTVRGGAEVGSLGRCVANVQTRKF